MEFKQKMKFIKIPLKILKNMTLYLNKTGCKEEQGTLKAYEHRNPLVRWIFWKRIKTMINLSMPSTRVLDYGCGAGALLYCLSKNINEVYGLDAETRPAEYLKRTLNLKNVKIIKQNSLRLPFQDNFFDIVYAADVLEHFLKKDVEDIHKEFKRVLKEDGYLIVSGPTENWIYRLAKKIIFRVKQDIYLSGDNKYQISHCNNINDIIKTSSKFFKIDKIIVLPLTLIPGFKIYRAKKVNKDTRIQNDSKHK